MEYCLAIAIRIYASVDKLRGHFIKCVKSNIGRQILYLSSVKYKNLQTHRNMVECYLPGGGSVGKAGKVFIRRYKFLVTWSAISGDTKYNLCGSRCVN